MVQGLLGIIVLRSVGHPRRWYGFDFIMIVPLLLSHCGFLSLDVEHLSLVSFSILLSMVV